VTDVDNEPQPAVVTPGRRRSVSQCSMPSLQTVSDSGSDWSSLVSAPYIDDDVSSASGESALSYEEPSEWPRPDAYDIDDEGARAISRDWEGPLPRDLILPRTSREGRVHDRLGDLYALHASRVLSRHEPYGCLPVPAAGKTEEDMPFIVGGWACLVFGEPA